MDTITQQIVIIRQLPQVHQTLMGPEDFVVILSVFLYIHFILKHNISHEPDNIIR